MLTFVRRLLRPHTINDLLRPWIPALTVTLSACATAPIDFSSFREVPMAEADVMPSPSQVQSTRTRVILLEMDDQAVRSRMSDAGALKLRKLQEVLAEGGVEIVDRGLANRLREEITLAEVRGDSQKPYSGPEVANFAIRGFMSDIGATSRYTPPSEYCDKNGKCRQTPPSCTFSGSASGGLRIYELPSLKLVNTLNLRGNASTSTSGYCYNDPSVLAGVARAAVEDAVYDSRFDLKNFFASKGYVAEKRIKEGRVIFKIMLGRSQGIKTEDRVVFYTLRKKENRLTRQVEFEEVMLTPGEVIGEVGDNFAWVQAGESSKQDQIRLGDYVRAQYKRGFFD